MPEAGSPVFPVGTIGPPQPFVLRCSGLSQRCLSPVRLPAPTVCLSVCLLQLVASESAMQRSSSAGSSSSMSPNSSLRSGPARGLDSPTATTPLPPQSAGSSPTAFSSHSDATKKAADHGAVGQFTDGVQFQQAWEDARAAWLSKNPETAGKKVAPGLNIHVVDIDKLVHALAGSGDPIFDTPVALKDMVGLLTEIFEAEGLFD